PSYLFFELESSSVLPGSSSNGSSPSHLPLPFLSSNFSPQTPVAVMVPSQSGFWPKGVITTAEAPTFNSAFGAAASDRTAIGVENPPSLMKVPTAINAHKATAAVRNDFICVSPEV